MVSCVLLILGPWWIHFLTQGCSGEELHREAALSWFKERVLEGLGLEEPPQQMAKKPIMEAMRHAPQRAPRMRKTAPDNYGTSLNLERSQVILFPTSDSLCGTFDSTLEETTYSHITYFFRPSINTRETLVTGTYFWFYAGKGAAANSSAQLFILSSAHQAIQVARDPSTVSSDGWTTYELDQNLLVFVAKGTFTLQVQCAACQCQSEPDNMPFLHLHTQTRSHVRSPRPAPVTIPWSPSAIDLLQRPSQEIPQETDCHHAEVEISFEELGWDNWIVDPKVLTFYYCHGNFSARGRTTTMLGMKQCCAPNPGTMKSLRITATSDGGYSFQHEILPNLIPEQCSCF